jgi:hypothetical protein
MQYERIPTDAPIRQIWNRLGILSSISGAQKCLAQKATITGQKTCEKLLTQKAQGIAFCIRGAEEYFRVPLEGNLTSASLAYYYGTLNLLEALLLSDTANNITLERIESYTQGGHGLRTLSALSDATEGFPASEKVLVLGSGFMSAGFLTHSGYDVSRIAVTSQHGYRTASDLAALPAAERAKVFSVKDLLGRIPELRELYGEIFHEQPAYISFESNFSPPLKRLSLNFAAHSNTAYLTSERIREILDWLPQGIVLRKEDNSLDWIGEVVGDTAAGEYEQIQRRRKDLYSSCMAYSSYVLPLGKINDILLLNFMLLYCLSIWVRYRPSLWRDITEGKFDCYRPLFEAFLMAVQRLVPNQVLNRIYERDFHFAPFAYFA